MVTGQVGPSRLSGSQRHPGASSEASGQLASRLASTGQTKHGRPAPALPHEAIRTPASHSASPCLDSDSSARLGCDDGALARIAITELMHSARPAIPSEPSADDLRLACLIRWVSEALFPRRPSTGPQLSPRAPLSASARTIHAALGLGPARERRQRGSIRRVRV